MKKIFRTTYLALLLIAGLSCNNDPMPDAPKGKYPILFRCSDETRAVATVESMQEDENGFHVYAYFTTNTQPVNNASFDKKVKWDKDQRMWLYDDIEYWVVGATYWFKAVYPHGIAKVDNTNATQAVTITDYAISNQYDILVAETDRGGMLVTEQNQAPESGSEVSLQFQHLLANVTIKIKAEIDGVTINSITISDIADYGTYEESQWSSSNKTSITVEPKKELFKGEEYVDVTNGGILVIPAEANGVTLSISTSSKNYDNIKIPAINWEIDKKYTYTIEIQQSDIILNEPNVAKWDSDSATGSVIIK